LTSSCISFLPYISSNLPAPINASLEEQTKKGNLIIEGVLRLGQFTTANAPSGADGALYFDTTENKTKIYSSAAWADLGGGAEPGQLPTYTTAQRDALSPTDGFLIYNTTENKVQAYSSGIWRNISAKLSLAQTCTLDGDCDSTHCIDGYCCDTICTGNCNRCNIAGSIGTCTDVASDCTGNCDVCTAGNCAASNALCSGTTASCGCSGSGTVFNCTTCTDDPYGVCGHPICSSYTCAQVYDNGVACSTCHTCSSGSCTAHVPAGSTGLNCTATHYRCDGSGNCTAPTHEACFNCPCPGKSFTNVCASYGAESCISGYNANNCASGATACFYQNCYSQQSAKCNMYDY